MSEILLDRTVLYRDEFAFWEADMPHAGLEAKRMPGDTLIQKKAASLIGNVATSENVAVDRLDEPKLMDDNVSLSRAIESANNGDLDALKIVETNVVTDYIERSYKSGIVMEAILDKAPDGTLMQNGQTVENVHTNSLRYITNYKMRERSKIEALNSMRDQYYSDSGVFKDNVKITCSLVHSDMDNAQAAEAGFFTHTRSLAIQLVTEKEGKIVIQSAFVAGREDLLSADFDLEAVIRLARKFGVDYSGATSEEILSRPIIIPKKHLPDLILSVVKKYDESASEVTGKNKFFGRDIESMNNAAQYVEKAKESEKIMKKMKTETDIVVAKLLNARPSTPVEATTQLDTLNDQLLKSRIVQDKEIDVRVVGEKAAYYVNHARYLVDIGMQDVQMRILQHRINSKGMTSSCPGGAKNDMKEIGVEFDMFGKNGNENSDDDVGKLEDCEFISKECPKCGQKDVKTTCKDGKYTGECGCKSD